MTKLKIAAMADLHMQQSVFGSFKLPFEEISNNADILLLGGDLTEHGLEAEANMLAEELNYCTIPTAGVLGNHDYTNGEQEKIVKILSSKINILSKQSFVYQKIGFAGVKGFGGGFDNHMVTPFGEDIVKKFVFEAVNEALKLEEDLTKLETEKKIVVLHYSPICQTVEGEPLEIYPFLGSSRLVEPIENYNVTAVFHGHAHHGSMVGKTTKGIPVYNASMSVMLKNKPHRPYMIVEI